jgi:hypothetical protein
MALFAAGFSNTLIMLILRRRFAETQSLAPRQAVVGSVLRIVLVCFGLLWLYCFVIGAKAVATGLLNESFVPLLFFLFAVPTATLWTLAIFGRSLRAQTKATEELAEEIQALHATRLASDNWSEAWRSRAVEALKAQLVRDPESVNSWLESWYIKRYQRFRAKAFRAVVVLGEPSYREVLDMFHKHNMEDIKRWSLITGKAIPKSL